MRRKRSNIRRYFCVLDIVSRCIRYVALLKERADRGEASDAPTSDLKEAVISLKDAARQIGSVGDADQVARATAIVVEARRQVYELLAKAKRNKMSIPLSKRFAARMGALPKVAPAVATDEVTATKPARIAFKTSHHSRLPELDKPNAYMAELEAHDAVPVALDALPTSRN